MERKRERLLLLPKTVLLRRSLTRATSNSTSPKSSGKEGRRCLHSNRPNKAVTSWRNTDTNLSKQCRILLRSTTQRPIGSRTKSTNTRWLPTSPQKKYLMPSHPTTRSQKSLSPSIDRQHPETLLLAAINTVCPQKMSNTAFPLTVLPRDLKRRRAIRR